MAASAKDLIVKPISPQAAADCIRRLHYSGRTVRNSQLHLGVFLDGLLQGAMQFGPPMDKSNVIGLVRGTKWNDFLELNRMAFGPALPRNSESRAIAVAMRLIRRHYPNIEWILSFSDGTQCGDGTIYRASGFVLTGIKPNKTILRLPDGRVISDISLNVAGRETGQTAGFWKRQGAKPLEGWQLRYVYFLTPGARERLAVPLIPFSKIDEVGARMYLGKRCAGSSAVAAPEDHSGEGGSIPTPALQLPDEP